ncbi:hypothetical protein M5J14_18550 [Lysinibacillus sp. OL1_EC]|uniref:hypothetical protein n=1 Tax=unclassified Lysinibacillus TaxID=2636778 RepID=UPI0010388C6D|nr:MULTISPECIES: hypothetical protein [unclassified Lysinibacillus]MCM0626499.1 hypothetical protein [Lysinibacillus sp. OL1_EC]TBV85640.1 hypothetical protein EW028_19635 [Lysinibacillus sp. OL1]
MAEVYMQLEMERFIELKRAEEENVKLRESNEILTRDLFERIDYNGKLAKQNIDAAKETEKLREALEKVMEVEAPIMEGWETPAYKIAHQALGGETHG